MKSASISLLSIAAFLIVPALLTTTSSFAQDTLQFQNGRKVAVAIDEIGLEEIKYHEPGDAIRVSVDKNDVSRIILHNGRVITVRNDGLGVGYSDRILSKTHVVKMEVLSLAFDHLTLGYEQVLKPWMNVEVRASYIGVGNANMAVQAKGMMIAGGIKFIARPDHIMRGMKLGHPLQGRYVKPEILINTFTLPMERVTSYDYDWNTGWPAPTITRTNVHYTNMAFNLVLGKQRFLGDGITLDTWVGIGYGFQTGHADDGIMESERGYSYSHVWLGKQTPFALSAGMSLGVAF